MNNDPNEKFLKDQCTRIKFLVQQFSGIENIGIKSRKQIISDMKKIYCKICDTKTKASLNIIAAALRDGYNHASVINSIKKFDNLYETKQLLKPEVYKQTLQAINELEEIEVKEESASRLIAEYTTFLDWFRAEVGDETPIETSFFVGKYFAIAGSN